MTYHAQPTSLRGVIAGIVDAKATEYRGILMRSKLEADFARYLDGRGVTWRYEPAIFGPVGEGYLPDFQILRDDGLHFIEVKPTLREVREAKRRLEVIWKTYPRAMLVVACAEGSRFYGCEAGGDWFTWTELWKHS